MKTGKNPKQLEMVDKKEVNEKAENKDVDLDIVPGPRDTKGTMEIFEALSSCVQT